ncbi:MAG: ABC transporter permease [Propionibacteriaceae bacterium]|jgi:ABC-type transport system involved in multi-copper enzyme maturation permease subunit|nr:ABC transporter permease [Propionibacteriaceae bacterium]
MKTWSLSWRGVKTVAGLEVRLRLRSKRWIWALAAWFIVIGAISVAMMWWTYDTYGPTNPGPCIGWGGAPLDCRPITVYDRAPWIFGIVAMLILGLALLITPAFSATSINGDRQQGTLATLQATRLSAVEIVTGKLLAAWAAAAVFLVVALPFLGLLMVMGNISILQVLVCFLVIFLIVAIFGAVGLGWSALFTRTTVSTLVTYLTLAIVTASSLIFLLRIPMPQELGEVWAWEVNMEKMRVYVAEIDDYYEQYPTLEDGPGIAIPEGLCTWERHHVYYTKAPWAMWVMAANPFVIVSDASPPTKVPPDGGSYSGLGTFSWEVREMGRGPVTEEDRCTNPFSWTDDWWETWELVNGLSWDDSITTRKGNPVEMPPTPTMKERPPAYDGPLWPYGLGAYLLVGAVFFYLSVRKLRLPHRTLPKGTRIA